MTGKSVIAETSTISTKGIHIYLDDKLPILQILTGCPSIRTQTGNGPPAFETEAQTNTQQGINFAN